MGRKDQRRRHTRSHRQKFLQRNSSDQPGALDPHSPARSFLGNSRGSVSPLITSTTSASTVPSLCHPAVTREGTLCTFPPLLKCQGPAQLVSVFLPFPRGSDQELPFHAADVHRLTWPSSEGRATKSIRRGCRCGRLEPRDQVLGGTACLLWSFPCNADPELGKKLLF